MRRLRVFCLCALVVCMFCNNSVSAANPGTGPDSGRTGSIAVLSYVDGKKVPDVKFNAWRIGDYDSSTGEITISAGFKKYGLYFNPLDMDSVSRFTGSLYDYIRRDDVRLDYTAVSDSQGVALFENLELGAYLIASEVFERDGVEYKSSPMLVYIPNLNDFDELVYSAEVEAKFTGSRIPDKPGKISRRVLKTWDDQDDLDGLRPDEIEVDLLRNGKRYDTVVLNRTNQWRYVWDDLDERYDWSVVERTVPDGYESYVDYKGITFVIDNVHEPERPEKPTPPPPSVPPEENPPVTTTTPNPPRTTPGGPPSTPDIPENPPPPPPTTPKIPQTGQLWWPVPVLTIAGLAVLLVGVFVRRRDD